MLNRKTVVLGLIIVLLLMVACAPAQNEPGAAPDDTEATTPVQEPTAEPEPTETPEAMQAGTEAIEAAYSDVAEMLGVEESAIQLESITDMEWPNACLGLPEEGEMCAEVITPGFLIVLEADGRVYEVRTDLQGETVRLQETSDPTEELPAAAVEAQQAVAAERNVEATDVNVVSFERREWSDSCLGLGGPAESCLQAITPGWLVTLEVEGETVEVRTDESGEQVRIASKAKPGAPASGAAIVLSRSGGIDGGVTEWRIYSDGRVEKATGLEAVESQPTVEQVQLDPEAVDELLNNLEEAGFFDLSQSYVPADTCCDRYMYNLSVNVGPQVHSVAAVDATEEVPEEVWQSIDLVQEFVESKLNAD